MAIQKAIIPKENVFYISSAQTIGEAIELMHEKEVRVLPVVDEGDIVGIFSLSSIIFATLPKALTLQEDIPDMDFIHGVTADIKAKLEEMRSHPVLEIMEKELECAHPETSATEALRMLYVYGSPIPVVERETTKFLGIVTSQSILSFLENYTTS